ncbi:MAG: spore cortex biosynthesis protein YabQ [Lachnospiraceae bacterium]|nr:spore cortex biosynthesis protein YabQ [Lachnospiraceae bacterium]
MSASIIGEFYFWIYSIATGIGLALLYDMLRLWRRMVRHRRWQRDIEDIFYWILCFFISFYLLYYGNNGVIRYFAVMGAGLGMLLYSVTVGRFLTSAIYRLLCCLMMPFSTIKNGLTRWKKHLTMKVRESAVGEQHKGDERDVREKK